MFPDHYTIDRTGWRVSFTAQAQLYGEPKGEIFIVLKQLHYFSKDETNPNLRPGWLYVNGQAEIDGIKVWVQSKILYTERERYRANPETLVFELVGGETIPVSWRD